MRWSRCSNGGCCPTRSWSTRPDGWSTPPARSRSTSPRSSPRPRSPSGSASPTARCAAERTGVTAKWLIERRRLQHAAETLRRNPSESLAGLAAELGYADQAHFTRRYRDMLGEPPGRSRRHALGLAPG
ncbi:helix-turn-helix domain-containing protein [Melissospora conviva]|uniref:helix-turn-helix domain-containing protein n=1 Tax=Melissospora conviva TaxID=3388432 RepID=UPI003B7C8FB0